MRFEVKRQDADDSEWKEAGTTDEGTAVTSEELQALQQNSDFLTDLVHVAAETATEGVAVPIHRYQSYQKWSASIDTIALELEDTIDAASPAARDASLDANPYVVRAIAVSAANESEVPSPDGVKSTFSLDNVDDVAPLGPTNIVAVADVAGALMPTKMGVIQSVELLMKQCNRPYPCLPLNQQPPQTPTRKVQ